MLPFIKYLNSYMHADAKNSTAALQAITSLSSSSAIMPKITTSYKNQFRRVN